jgi:hypothetical protein
VSPAVRAVPETPQVADASIGELIGDVTRDLSTLMRQEFELATAELKQEVVNSGKAAGTLSGAGFAGWGNPLAAGLIAFGCGWLAGSLIQSSRKERELARQVKDRLEKQVQPVAQQVQQAASDVADNLRVPAQQTVESIKSAGRDAASTVTAESRAAMDQVSDRVEQAKRNVGDRASGYPTRQR